MNTGAPLTMGHVIFDRNIDLSFLLYIFYSTLIVVPIFVEGTVALHGMAFSHLKLMMNIRVFF